MAESNRRHFLRQNEEATIQVLITTNYSNAGQAEVMTSHLGYSSWT